MANVQSGTAGGGPQVFTRTASGLTRSLSVVDLAFYGILCCGTVATLWFFYPFAQSIGNGVSMSRGVFLYIPLIIIPISVVYAALGSAMPRSGGDYVYVSRILSPIIGFSFIMGCFVIFWIATGPFGGMTLTQLGLNTFLSVLGYQTHNATLISWSNAVVGKNWVLASVLIIFAICFVVNVAGMRVFRKIQKYFLFPAILVSLGALLYLLLKSSTADVVGAVNHWGSVTMNDPNLYQKVLDTAHANGFVPSTKVNYWNTWVWVTLPLAYTAYIVFGAQGLLGEVKNARNFKLLTIGFLAAGVYAVVAMGLSAYLFEHRFTTVWVQASAYCYNNGLIQFPFSPSILYWSSILSSNAVPAFLIMLGILANSYLWPQSSFLNATRVIVGMSMDGVLPEWMGKISQRTFAPINATIVYLIIGLAFTFPFIYWSSFYYVVISAASMGYIGGYIATGASATLFPWRHRDMYLSSPVSKYRILGIPVITIFGAWLTVVAVAVFLTIFFVPALGAASTVPRLVILGSIVGCMIWFVLYKAYRGRQGVNIDAAFAEIPPE